MKTYECKVCGAVTAWGYSKTNIYCSNKCQGQDRIIKNVDLVKQGLIKERPAQRNVLTHLYGYKCAVCAISDWNDKSITLQVDHIDGTASNNSLENLRLICPNCHSQTDSYAGRNRGKGRKALGIKRK